MLTGDMQNVCLQTYRNNRIFFCLFLLGKLKQVQGFHLQQMFESQGVRLVVYGLSAVFKKGCIHKQTDMSIANSITSENVKCDIFVILFTTWICELFWILVCRRKKLVT